MPLAPPLDPATNTNRAVHTACQCSMRHLVQTVRACGKSARPVGEARKLVHKCFDDVKRSRNAVAAAISAVMSVSVVGVVDARWSLA